MTTPPELAKILEAACAAAGLQADDAEPVRLGENAIFRLRGKIIARIAREGQQAAARREVAVSRWLNASGVAAAVTIEHIEQPVEVAGRSVTFWEELPQHQQGDLMQVARTLKRLHTLPIPDDIPLGDLSPFVRLDERIKGALTISDDDRAWLRARLSELEQKWAALAPGLPTCVVHGDAWADNVVATDDGQVILLDLERCSVGPNEWDLVSTAVKYVTYGRIDRGQYIQFSEAYGFDVTTWHGFTLLRDIRELRMTCYASQQAAAHERIKHEAQLRVDCLRGRRGTRPWPWTPAE
jgi:aminoglycoside phosphotransferase (APT) family kinase protein